MNRPFFLNGVAGGVLDAPPPVHIPGPLVSVLYNAIPIVILSYGFWDQYADYLQSQSLSVYKGNKIEEYDFIIGKPKTTNYFL